MSLHFCRGVKEDLGEASLVDVFRVFQSPPTFRLFRCYQPDGSFNPLASSPDPLDPSFSSVDVLDFPDFVDSADSPGSFPDAGGCNRTVPFTATPPSGPWIHTSSLVSLILQTQTVIDSSAYRGAKFLYSTLSMYRATPRSQ